MRKAIVLLFIVFYNFIIAQNNPNPGYWQQQADYKMELSMDVKTFQYKGTQTLEYSNNSNDTLRKVFYHLYFNAFQNENASVDIANIMAYSPEKKYAAYYYFHNQFNLENALAHAKSNQEIAALSRSCHESQGFGSTGSRGEEMEYLEFIKGEAPKDSKIPSAIYFKFFIIFLIKRLI